MLDDIETAFTTAVLAINGIKSAHKVEPNRLDQLPAVTMFFIGCPSISSSTGYNVVSWTWRVSITVSMSDLAEAQNELKTYIPQLLAITRADPDLGNTCDWAELNDREEEPFALEDSRGLRKNLYLVAQTTETF